MITNRKSAITVAHRTMSFSLVLGFVFVCAGGAAFAQQPLPGSVVTMQNGKSKYYLTQDYSGNRDDKRNVSVWPRPDANTTDNGFRWYLTHPVFPHTDRITGAPLDIQWWHIINVATSLRLTRDGNDQNVSNWTSDASLYNNQLWKFVEGPGENEFHIVNKLEMQLLDQAYQGNRDDERNVTVWPIGDVTSFADQGFSWYLHHQESSSNLAKLTIKSIKCYVTSSGATLVTDVVVGSLVSIAMASSCPQCPLGADLAAGALAAGATAKLDDATSAVDMVYITANHVRVWPEEEYSHKVSNLHEGWAAPYSGFFRPMDNNTQKELRVNESFIFDKSKGLAIGIWEYDYGSHDDRLGGWTWGRSDIPGSPAFPESFTDRELTLYDESEGSIYSLIVSIEDL